jgi:spore coat protein A, manganese oxidase
LIVKQLSPTSKANTECERANAMGLLPDITTDKWRDLLPIPAVAVKTVALDGTWEYRLPLRKVSHRFNGNMTNPVDVWTYGSSVPGETIEAEVGTAVRVTWVNDLHSTDLSSLLEIKGRQGMEEPHMLTKPHNQVHLHGARVPWTSDGHPMFPFHPGETRGYLYPNEQDAATLWYHDHTMDVTRLNVYAGLAGMYLLREKTEHQLLPTGEFEIPLILQDRSFNKAGTKLKYDQKLVVNPGAAATSSTRAVSASLAATPEFLGDFPVVNGAIWPLLEADATMYRFRIVNGANARFFVLSFVDANDATSAKIDFTVVGSDGGFLKVPKLVSELILGPGERADVLLDLRVFDGHDLRLRNTAMIPYPGDGTAPLTPMDACGELLKIAVRNAPLAAQAAKVAANSAKVAGGIRLPARDPGIAAAFVPSAALAAAANAELDAMASSTAALPDPKIIKVGSRSIRLRRFVLRERPRSMPTLEDPKRKDSNGVAVQIVPVESRKSPTVLINEKQWLTAAPVTVTEGDIEVWEFVNKSPDAHPMHIHLVEFKIIGRRQLPPLASADMPIEPYEEGPKDTVRCEPGQATRVLIRFDGYSGEYVYHCHILEHEDMGMMFRLNVEPKKRT